MRALFAKWFLWLKWLCYENPWPVYDNPQFIPTGYDLPDVEEFWGPREAREINFCNVCAHDFIPMRKWPVRRKVKRVL